MLVFMRVAKESSHNRVIIDSDNLTRLNRFATIKPSMTMKGRAYMSGKVIPRFRLLTRRFAV